MRNALGLLVVAVAISSAAAADADVKATVYSDGAIILTLPSRPLEGLTHVEMFDLSSADEVKRREVIADFLAGKYDGVYYGAPEGEQTVRAACDTLVDCGKHVKKVCKELGSSGTEASIEGSGSCSGACADGTQIIVLCTD
jgi:hypothetical protein